MATQKGVKGTLHLNKTVETDDSDDNQNTETTSNTIGNDTSRLDYLEQIADSTEHDKLLFGESTDDQEKETGSDQETEENSDQETEVQDDKTTDVSDEPDTVTLIVDGVERKVARADVEAAGIRALQKESAADKRLEEATRILREAQQIKPLPHQDAVSDDELSLVRTIQVGEPEEAAQALRALKEQAKTTPQEMTFLVDARLQFQKAVDWLQTDGKDIWDDPRLRRQMAFEEEQLRAKGDTRPHLDVYKEIVTDLRKWRGSKATTLEDKREQKANTTVDIPTAAGKKPVPQPDDDDEDVSSVIDKMRKARGQQFR